jgi:hypothetical protein
MPPDRRGRAPSSACPRRRCAGQGRAAVRVPGTPCRRQGAAAAAGGPERCGGHTARRAIVAGMLPGERAARACGADGRIHGAVHATARVAWPARRAVCGVPGCTAAAISSCSAAAPCRGTTVTVADDPQLGGPGDARYSGHQVRDALHPLGERRRQPGPAAGAGLGGRRGGVAEDLFPPADRRLVVTPRHGGVAGNRAGGRLPGRPGGGEGTGRSVEVPAALAAVAGPTSPPAVVGSSRPVPAGDGPVPGGSPARW